MDDRLHSGCAEVEAEAKRRGIDVETLGHFKHVLGRRFPAPMTIAGAVHASRMMNRRKREHQLSSAARSVSPRIRRGNGLLMLSVDDVLHDLVERGGRALRVAARSIACPHLLTVSNMSSMVQRLLQQFGTGNSDVHQILVIQVHEHHGYLGSPKGLAQPLHRNPHKAEWSQGRNIREGRTGD